MNLAKLFQEYIRQHQLFMIKDKLLLAMSGGVDSVALCHLCKEAGFSFAIAHCNFQLRGAESDRDEKFVKSLAEKMGVVSYVKTFETEKIASQQKRGIEETARDLRYEWFYELQIENHYQYILTAHHADDNVETSVMHFFRGTGINGLRGMLPKNGKIVRPLLFARKQELLNYASLYQLDFVTDATNADEKFTRNFFRNKVLPLIESVYPAAAKNLINNTERFTDVALLYQQAIDLHKKNLIEQKGRIFQIPVLKLKKAIPLNTIVYEIISAFGFTAHQTEEVVSLLDSASGKFVNSTTHCILKNRNWLIISPLQEMEAAVVVIDELDTDIHFGGGVLKMRSQNHVPAYYATTPLEACIDGKDITFPILLRKWKTGDYFYPLGMKKKKKLSRFFIDSKLSRLEKENVWVLETNKRIVWVMGYRIDDRFKIMEHTTSVLKFQYLPAK